MENQLCPDCGHKISLHADRFGCQHERGDVFVEGNVCGGWVAPGPCGCKAVLRIPAEPVRLSPEQEGCSHPSFERMGIHSLFRCRECGAEMPIPELEEIADLDVATEPMEGMRAYDANSRMLLDALKGNL